MNQPRVVGPICAKQLLHAQRVDELVRGGEYTGSRVSQQQFSARREVGTNQGE